jgi:hypothetical protein
MAAVGITPVDGLARAVRSLADYRRWTRDQALLRGARCEDLEEYARVTARLLELDQQYWLSIAVANAAVVEARRGLLSPAERRALTDRVFAPFQDLFRTYEERAQPLLVQLPEMLRNGTDPQRRRNWVLGLDNALVSYALGVQDAVEALREERPPGTVPPLKQGAAAFSDERR